MVVVVVVVVVVECALIIQPKNNYLISNRTEWCPFLWFFPNFSNGIWKRAKLTRFSVLLLHNILWETLAGFSFIRIPSCVCARSLSRNQSSDQLVKFSIPSTWFSTRFSIVIPWSLWESRIQDQIENQDLKDQTVTLLLRGTTKDCKQSLTLLDQHGNSSILRRLLIEIVIPRQFSCNLQYSL